MGYTLHLWFFKIKIKKIIKNEKKSQKLIKMINKEKKSEKIPEKLIKMIKKSGKMKREKNMEKF